MPTETLMLLAQVAMKSLNSQITLSTRELLAVAPEIRRLKELVTTKRIPSAFNIEIGDQYQGCEEIDRFYP
jgi:hypothetical protein